ncbi:MAG: bifunctional molybdenum cofactor biosynthesis protein MoaC/MoaB [Candidatus Zixiibacteriota bacterium]
MLDVSRKFTTLRTATATATLRALPETLALVREGKVPKGEPLTVAKVAAVQAAKNTSQIIPYCHPIPVDAVNVDFTLLPTEIRIETAVTAVHKTGVEMEALTAAAVAALTLYDMLKPLDDSLEITGIRLVRKRGGKDEFRDSFAQPLRAAVLVLSDSIAAGAKSDASGRLIVERLRMEGVEVADYKIIPDEQTLIETELCRYADDLQLDLVMTTGGTGLGPRDQTPEAMSRVIEREVPGIAEAARTYGQQRTPFAMLSRGRAGVRGRTLIVNLPGSRRGVAESLDALFPGLLHIFKMLAGGGHPADPARSAEPGE